MNTKKIRILCSIFRLTLLFFATSKVMTNLATNSVINLEIEAVSAAATDSVVEADLAIEEVIVLVAIDSVVTDLVAVWDVIRRETI